MSHSYNFLGITRLRTETFSVCVIRKTIINCLCSSSCHSASFIRNIREFGVKIYFTKHQTAQLFVSTKRKFFGSILFQNKSQSKGNSLEATR